MESKSILIVDDHPVYRDALHQFLTKKFSSSDIQIFSAKSILEGRKIIEEKPSSWFVLLDLLITDSNNELEGITKFKELSNVISIAAISGLEKSVIEKACLDAGCEMFISKNSESAEIYENLCALIGEVPETPDINQLTTRQKEILKHISEGHSNKMIAYSLKISEQTVKIHLGEIFRKIKVFNRTQAVIKAKEHGWV